MKNTLLPAISAALHCPKCESVGCWINISPDEVRLNSIISKFRCSHCGKKIVSKMAPISTAQETIKSEYDTLVTMRNLLACNEPFRSPTPLVYFENDGHGVMLTEFIEGVDLAHCAKALPLSRSSPTFKLAGRLLRRLHDASPKREMRALDLASRITYLVTEYGDMLRSRGSFRRALDMLRNTSSLIDSKCVCWTWVHGDFKPQNIIYDEQGIVVFDTTLNAFGTFVFDIGQFLAHIELLFLGVAGMRDDIRHKLASDFVDGYGVTDSGELSAIAWARLYFILTYYGQFCRGGILRRLVAGSVFHPAIARSMQQLSSIVGRA